MVGGASEVTIITESKVAEPLSHILTSCSQSCTEGGSVSSGGISYRVAVQQLGKHTKCGKIILSIVFSHRYELS